MNINKRIEKAQRRTIDLFNKKNALIQQANLSIEIESYKSLVKEGRRLKKICSKYDKAHSRLDKLEMKNNCKRVGIVEEVMA